MEEEPVSREFDQEESKDNRGEELPILGYEKNPEYNRDLEYNNKPDTGIEPEENNDNIDINSNEDNDMDELDLNIPLLSEITGDEFSQKSCLSEDDLERINKYKKFKKVDGSAYRRVNQFLRKHTYITAREWAIARLCADFTTRGGAEMTFIGENLPELVPFMIDTYTPQAVNQARSSFKRKVRKSGATFFYGALCGFFTADELDDILFESSEIARFLLEIEGTSIDIDDEIDIEDRITEVMRSVAEAASMLRTGNLEKEERKISPDKNEKKTDKQTKLNE